jgi:hypothetical protein
VIDRETTAEEVTRLVLGVARLGEADLAGWWSTHGLDRPGRYVLSRSLPRTWRSGALELDVLSAARRHEDALDRRRTALHLFSDELPFRRWAAAWLAEQKTASRPDPLFAELIGWDLDSARSVLADWAGPAPGGEVVGNGLLLGELGQAELADADALVAAARLLAGAYPAIDGMFRAPYFDRMG